MAELKEIKTIELEPAKVVFNHEEIEKDLEENLQKYNGLTFTENDATECRKTIAELRKGKKAVDEYRKQVKKQLTAPVTEFEGKCKALNKKFDEVIHPLIEQNEAFETKRRNDKRKQVQEVIAQTIEEYDLPEKYAAQLVVEDEHLTKSRTMKSIKEEVMFQADKLKVQMEKEIADKENIANAVKLANAENELNLPETSYVGLIDYKDIESIKQQISTDTEKEIKKREQEEARKQAELEKQSQKQQQEEKTSQEIVQDHIQPVEDTIPFSEPDMIPDFSLEEEPVFEIYKVTATESQLRSLEEFMNANGLKWEVTDNE